MSNEIASDLSTLFASAGWTRNTQNFEPREYVKWHGNFYTVAGTLRDGASVAKACQTEADVMAFLASLQNGLPEPVVVAAPVQPAPEPETEPSPAPRDEALAAAEAELAILRTRVAELEQPAPPPQTDPEHHFADLMLADETIDDAKARLSQRLRDLRHYLIAPEIKVNEDGSVGLTPGEQVELQDLERRQTLGRWLDA
jgi:hypothetical protein